MTNDFSDVVDMWTLDCLIHELLTGEILFRDSGFEDYEISKFDLGSQELMVPQTGMYAPKSFCDDKTEYPIDIMTMGGGDRIIQCDVCCRSDMSRGHLGVRGGLRMDMGGGSATEVRGLSPTNRALTRTRA